MTTLNSELVRKGDVIHLLPLLRETKDSVKAERLNALVSKIKYAMVNENLVVVVLKMPR